MKNLGQLMKQAQAMQSKMAELQKQMEDAEVEGSSGGGMVTAIVNGKYSTSATKAGGYETLMDLIDELIASEAAEN